MTKSLPHDEHAERMVLGALLRQPDLFFETTGMDERWFYVEVHRKIFRIIRDLLFGEKEVPRRAFQAFVSSGFADLVGSESRYFGQSPREYVETLTEDIVSPAVQYRPQVERLCDAVQRRCLIESARSTYLEAADGEDVADVIANSHSRTSEIAAIRPEAGVSLDQEIDDWYERSISILDNEEGATAKIATNIWGVDKLLGGGGTFGRYTLIAALPKMGKSRITTRIAYELLRRGVPVDHYAVEMTTNEMLCLYAACICGVSYDWLVEHTEDDDARYEKHRHLTKARAGLKELPLHIYPGRRDIREIELNTHTRCAKSEGVAVIVDYIQIVRSRAYPNKFDRVSDVTERLAQLAPSTGCWLIGCAQFNREGAKSPGIPKYWQLRDSGQIEQDVDELLVLHRPYELKDEASKEDLKYTILDLQLTRHTSKSRVEVSSDLPLLRFGHVDDYAF